MGQLFFFIVATMLLCCRSMTKPVLVTNLCFSYFWAVPGQHQGFCFLLCCFMQGGWSVEEACRGTNWPKGWTVPYNMFNSKTWWGRCVFPKYLLLRDCLGTGLQLGGDKWLPLHHFIFFLFIYEFIFVSAHKFSCFSPFISLPQPNAGELARDQMRA